MKLIRRSKRFYGNHVSYDIIDEFESIIEKAEHNLETIDNNYHYPKLLKQLLLKTCIPFNNFTPKKNGTTFAIHLGPDFARSIPYYLTNRYNNGYFFDIWPNRYKQMEKFLKRSNIKNTFFSSKQTASFFKELGFQNVYWIPEAIIPTNYLFFDYSKKDIDVLELGRKHQYFHNKITPLLSEKKYSHFYEKKPGEIIFPDKQDFIRGLARTKISICFPKSITHPESAEGVETMTVRYLQSMASKCLVVGKLPAEMKELFNYSPIIEINLDNADEEIVKILNNYESYIPLIEQNYTTVMNYHSWESRWKRIQLIIGTNLLIVTLAIL
jgi:hypothetical protein